MSANYPPPDVWPQNHGLGRSLDAIATKSPVFIAPKKKNVTVAGWSKVEADRLKLDGLKQYKLYYYNEATEAWSLVKMQCFGLWELAGGGFGTKGVTKTKKGVFIVFYLHVDDKEITLK